MMKPKTQNRELLHSVIDTVLDLNEMISKDEMIFHLKGYGEKSDNTVHSTITDFDEFLQEVKSKYGPNNIEFIDSDI